MRSHLIFATIIAVIFTTTSISAREYTEGDYNYPYKDPYLATATTAILAGDDASGKDSSTIIRVPGIRGRNRLPGLEGRDEVSLALYRQDASAPLLFIIPGLGSSPYFGVAPYLAKLFYREGFHVVTLPSTMSWNFALAASRSGAPGYAPSDARDLYDVMQRTMKVLQDREKLKISKTHLLGVSLGALVGAHLAVIDETDRKIGITNYLLINPPVDIAYATQKIDEWNGLAKELGAEQAQQIIAKAIGIVDSFADPKLDDPAVFGQLAEKFSTFTKKDLQFLIAEHLQNQLAELIYVTQAIHDQKILTAPKNDKRARLAEAKNFTLRDYNQKIALPLWQSQGSDRQATVQSFMERGSLISILDQLRNNPKVHIIHNADDLFIEPSSLEKLKESLGDQLTLYPHGGHLGNLWFPENTKFAVNYIRGSADTSKSSRQLTVFSGQEK